MRNRVIGRFSGSEPGPLVVIFGAMHGNEPAGVQALDEVFRMLEKEPETNPSFVFKGDLLGVIGNVQAYETGQRYLEKDLNRQWSIETLNRIARQNGTSLGKEDLEIHEIDTLLLQEIKEKQPEILVLLDLHTTSAAGGIFCIPTDAPSSLRLAKELHAPVILGLISGLDGTLLRFATSGYYSKGNNLKHVISVAFEAGQHDDPLSVSRAISAVIGCLRACACIHPDDVDNKHDTILMHFSANLPKVATLRHIHHILEGDAFKMRPGYINFQTVSKNEHLADDIHGPILCPEDGRILMPLYQPKGTDGFFIVRSAD
jgi:succinylglutamate desuccinylase